VGDVQLAVSGPQGCFAMGAGREGGEVFERQRCREALSRGACYTMC
jgi:hypothetical protein